MKSAEFQVLLAEAGRLARIELIHAHTMRGYQLSLYKKIPRHLRAGLLP
ncbi:MAG: hypothetical protein RMZ41_016795 [Nostoc sp. DedVER02]|nr:hypothetical protein [Nostoc sp. DedVER02]MDZ7986160.1 hypothetical protein [Nostoc sp. DedVER02]